MIVGHQKQWKILKRLAELEMIPHAFLFYGENQLGKKTIALEFIKFLDCQSPEFSKKPCQVCRSCQDIQKGRHPDLVLIEPLGKEIKISQIRNLSERLSLQPYSAPFKAAIIDKAHLMNQEAQSCLLKTLEEPKGKALLILISECLEILLPTILSRVQKLRFYPVKNAEIENYLNTQKFSPDKIKDLVSFSWGRPGVAIDFLLNPARLEKERQRISDLAKLSDSDLAIRFQYVKDLSGDPQNLKEILDTWLRYLRNVLIENVSQKHPSTIIPGTKRYSLSRLKKILQFLQTINFLISTTNVNSRIALEMLMLEL